MSRRSISAGVAAALVLSAGVATVASSAGPPGGGILFVEPDPATGLSALYSVAPDGTGVRRVFPGSPADLQVARWSPDGRRFAFAYLDRGLYVANADGTELRRVATGDVRNVSWAPDSHRLVFARVDYASRAEHLYLETLGGTARRLSSITVGSENASEPAWSPDGRAIAYDLAGGPLTTSQIWVVSPNGTGKRRVAAGRLVLTPDWSADSGWIGYRKFSGVAYDLYIVRRDGSGVRRLTRTSGVAYGPRWAPTGNALAYVAYFGTSTQIVSQQAPNAAAKRIDDADGADHGAVLAWSPDATRIALYRRSGFDTTAEQGLYVKTVGVAGLTKIVDGPARPLDWR